MNEEKNSYELLALYFSGAARPEQAMSVEAWRTASAENQRDFERYGYLYGWPEQLRGNGYAAIDREKVGDLPGKTIVRSLRFRVPKLAVAAAIAGVVVSGILVYSLLKPAQTTVFAARGSEKTVRLESAEITLLEGASLRLSENRKVALEGCAEFNVRHSDEPFIVDVGSFHVKDLGTRFRIDAAPGADTVLVTVTEGTVAAYDDAGSNVVINAGEQATYIRSQKKLTLLMPKVLPARPPGFPEKPGSTQVQPLKTVPDTTNRKGIGRTQKKRVAPADKTPRTKGPRTGGSRTKTSRTGS